MKAIRLTRAEAVRVLQWAGGDADDLSGTITSKLRAAMQEAPKGVAVQPLEEALIKAARGKVVPLVAAGGGTFARASRTATELKATPEDAAILGAWMARQGWMRGTFTLLDVLNKWPSWFSKAKAEEAPRGLPEGLDGRRKETADVGPGAGGQRQAAASGRRKEGFG